MLNFNCRIRGGYEDTSGPTVWPFGLGLPRFPRCWHLCSLFITTCSVMVISVLRSSRSGFVKPPTKSVDARDMKGCVNLGKSYSTRPRLCCELLGVRPKSHSVSCRVASFPKIQRVKSHHASKSTTHPVNHSHSTSPAPCVSIPFEL